MSLKQYTPKQYNEMVKKASPNSKSWIDIPKAFVIGGLICCIGQLIGDLYLDAGLGKIAAATAASVTLVFIGALLTGLGVYDRIAVFAGGGSLVPITGFANSVVAPALEFKTEGLVTGTAAKMFVIAGPVIVYGVGASVVYGVLLCLFGG